MSDIIEGGEAVSIQHTIEAGSKVTAGSEIDTDNQEIKDDLEVENDFVADDDQFILDSCTKV